MANRLADSSGHGLDLIPVAGTTLSSASAGGSFGKKVTVAGTLQAAPFNLGASWTIEARVTLNTPGNTEHGMVFFVDDYLATGAYAGLYNSSSGTLSLMVDDGHGGGGAGTLNYTVPQGEEFTLAFGYDAATWSLYVTVNGTYQGRFDCEHSFASDGPNGYLRVGPNTDLVVDEIRVSTGLRYGTSNYTPATNPFTPDGTTVALYHCDDSFAGAHFASRYFPARYFARRYFSHPPFVGTYTLVADTGHVAVQGVAADLQKSGDLRLTAAPGNVAVQGVAADLRVTSHVLIADTGRVVVKGSPAILVGPHEAAPLQAGRQSRVPRWLLKFDRIGKTVYLSDVGGEVDGVFYVPAVIDVSHSEILVDLEKFTVPQPSCTVTISPSALRDYFVNLNELGQARVTVTAWNGKAAYQVIEADMDAPALGYDGDVTTFRLSEKFRHNPVFPERVVDYDGFSRATMEKGARFHSYPQVWGDAQDVPSFPIIYEKDAGGPGVDKWIHMIAGHATATPTGNGSPRVYHDALNAAYMGVELGATTTKYYDFEDAYDTDRAGALVHKLVYQHSGYPRNEIDEPSFVFLRAILNRYGVGGYIDQEGPLFDLMARRFQREFMFIVWQEGGKLYGWPIDPSAQPLRALVFHKHLLQLTEPVQEDKRWTLFKVRYKYSPIGADEDAAEPGWYGVKDLGPWNNPYLKAATSRWGENSFGDPVEWARHANSVDLADVVDEGAATTIVHHLAKVFHRGKRLKYLQQTADMASMRLGQMYALVDTDRGYNEQKALFIGKQYLSPELAITTFRTIEPLHDEQVPQGLWEVAA